MYYIEFLAQSDEGDASRIRFLSKSSLKHPTVAKLLTYHSLIFWETQQCQRQQSGARDRALPQPAREQEIKF